MPWWQAIMAKLGCAGGSWITRGSCTLSTWGAVCCSTAQYTFGKSRSHKVLLCRTRNEEAPPPGAQGIFKAAAAARCLQGDLPLVDLWRNWLVWFMLLEKKTKISLLSSVGHVVQSATIYPTCLCNNVPWHLTDRSETESHAEEQSC